MIITVFSVLADIIITNILSLLLIFIEMIILGNIQPLLAGLSYWLEDDQA